MNQIKQFGSKIFKSKFNITIIVLVIIFCAATIYAAAANSYSVEINVDNNIKRITTFKSDAYEILQQANISVGKDDIVDLSEFVKDTDSKISVYKVCEVTIYDGENVTRCTGIESVAKTLESNDITLGEDDAIDCDLTDGISNGMAITITRAFPVTISVDGNITKVNVPGGTVSDALDKAVVTIDDDDDISASLDTPLKEGMAIKVTKVTYSERTELSSIDFEKATEKTSSLTIGQSKIKQAGVNGEKKTTYKDKFVGGKLVESTAIKTEVTKDAVKEIKLVGTKVTAATAQIKTNAVGEKLASSVKTISTLKAPSSVTLNGNVPNSYKKKIVGTASAYSGGGLTATGRTVRNGYVAVNPRQIAYGTKMWIVSNDGNYVYGYASAEDTGGFTQWTGSRSTLCDLYMSSESQASTFGRRSVTIYVL